VSTRIPCVLTREEGTLPTELQLVSREAVLKIVSRAALGDPAAFLATLKDEGMLAEALTLDTDYIRIGVKSLNLKTPLRTDIYLRLGPNRFCKRFSSSDGFDATDLEKDLRAKGIDAFYLHRDQASLLFEDHAEVLDDIINDIDLDPEVAREAALVSLEIIHDVVGQLGFSSQVMDLAKKTVAITLKAIGANPKLSDVLARLRRHEGKYIASHSIMLAEIACAIAHRVAWGDASTFLKLSLAAFLHDLALQDNRLARLKTIADFNTTLDFSSADLNAFKTHPQKAAEYARHLEGIPPDVDTVVIQHHELPDGSGFPRGLTSQQINPLAAVFIIAHELMHFFLEQVPSNSRTDMLKVFLLENRSRYAEAPHR